MGKDDIGYISRPMSKGRDYFNLSELEIPASDDEGGSVTSQEIDLSLYTEDDFTTTEESSSGDSDVSSEMTEYTSDTDYSEKIIPHYMFYIPQDNRNAYKAFNRHLFLNLKPLHINVAGENSPNGVEDDKSLNKDAAYSDFEALIAYLSYLSEESDEDDNNYMQMSLPKNEDLDNDMEIEASKINAFSEIIEPDALIFEENYNLILLGMSVENSEYSQSTNIRMKGKDPTVSHTPSVKSEESEKIIPAFLFLLDSKLTKNSDLESKEKDEKKMLIQHCNSYCKVLYWMENELDKADYSEVDEIGFRLDLLPSDSSSDNSSLPDSY